MLLINHSKYWTAEREINLQISVTLKMKTLWNDTGDVMSDLKCTTE